jgi:flavin-dependent dehydrogenase
MFPILKGDGLATNEVFASLQVSQTGRFFAIDEGHALVMVNRKDLSAQMLARATQAGAVHIRSKITTIDPTPDGVALVDDSDNLYDAKFVVGADGVGSMVRKRFWGKLDSSRTISSLCRFYEGGPTDPTLIQVTPFPGYCWAFARNDRLAVGIGALEKGHDLRPFLNNFMDRFYPNRKPISDLQGAQLPHMNSVAAYTEKRVQPNAALVGDAAGFCDTLTGEGILYAVWSADLLANALLKGRPESYDTAWKKAFGTHLLLGGVLALHLFSTKNIDRFFLALTVCPSFRKVFMDFVWNQPPYPKLFTRLLASIPGSLAQWRRFRKSGGTIAPKTLGQFQFLVGKLNLIG